MAGLFQDDQGNTSSLRWVWVLTMLTILGVWAYISVVNKGIAHMSTGDVAWIGILMAGKAGQKHLEKK